MKKTTRFFSAVAIFIFLVSTFAVSASAVLIGKDGFYFEFDTNNNAILKEYHGSSEELIIPADIYGNPVIEDVKILNTETQIESKNNKASRLDIEVLANDKTYINVELQCVDSGDLYSRSVFYASSMMVQHSESSKGYNEPNVISIWIIRDKIKSGIIANRISPIEEIVHCTLPTKWNEDYEVFSDNSRII